MVATNAAMLVPPMVAMMGLTALVWVFMYVRRLGYMTRHGVDAQSVNTPQKMAAAVPEAVEFASNNFKNLFELPVLFYALCLLMTQQGWVDAVAVEAAWVFVALRALHSAIQCTVNVVMWRFAAYVASSIALWVLLVRVAMQVWA